MLKYYHTILYLKKILSENILISEEKNVFKAL